MRKWSQGRGGVHHLLVVNLLVDAYSYLLSVRSKSSPRSSSPRPPSPPARRQPPRRRLLFPLTQFFPPLANRTGRGGTRRRAKATQATLMPVLWLRIFLMRTMRPPPTTLLIPHRPPPRSPSRRFRESLALRLCAVSSTRRSRPRRRRTPRRLPRSPKRSASKAPEKRSARKAPVKLGWGRCVLWACFPVNCDHRSKRQGTCPSRFRPLVYFWICN